MTGSIRATTRASVVPHAPAPTTATRGPAISPSASAGLARPDAPPPPRGPLPDPTGALRELLATRQLDRGAVAEDEPDRRPVEAEPLAQPVLEVAPVAEVDGRRVRGEEHEGRRRDGGLGRVEQLRPVAADRRRRRPLGGGATGPG